MPYCILYAKNDMNTSKPLKICVLRLTALGDCINAFGFLQAVKKNNPHAELLWIIDKRFSSLFRDSTGTDLITMVEVDFKPGLLSALLDLRRKLKGQRFDVLLNMQTSIKASLCSLLISAKLKFGYDRFRSRELQFLFVNRRVTSPNNPHVLAGFMAFGKQAGLGDLNPCWDFKLSDQEISPFRKLLSNKKIFTLSPASAKASKNWTVEGYSAIALYAQSQGFEVVLTGGNKDSEVKLCEEIEKKLFGKCLNLCGKTSLRELACLISLSSVVLSPDSAAMHLASALNIPVIGLFAIHNPKRVGSWNYPQLWVSVYNDLAKKELGTNAQIPWRYRVKTPSAMKQISVEQVKSAFDKAVELSLFS